MHFSFTSRSTFCGHVGGWVELGPGLHGCEAVPYAHWIYIKHSIFMEWNRNGIEMDGKHSIYWRVVRASCVAGCMTWEDMGLLAC